MITTFMLKVCCLPICLVISLSSEQCS